MKSKVIATDLAATGERPRVLLADDHDLVRRGARAVVEHQLGWEICGEAENGRDAVALAERLQPDIAVLDVGMPDLNGLDALRQIRRATPNTEVIILSGNFAESIVQECFEAGARSFLCKGETSEHLTAALRAAAARKPYFTDRVSQVVFARFNKGDGEGGQPLSPREREVVALLANGGTNKDIANALRISVRTVETHRAVIMRKLRTDSVSGIVRYAVRNGLVNA